MSGKGKGKAKAVEPTESDPLLPSASSSRLESTAQHVRPRQSRNKIWSIFYTILIVLFSLLIAALLFFILLAYSFKPSESELAELPSKAFTYSGPDSVQVLNITDNGIWVNVSVRLGIDADMAMGLDTFESVEDKDDAASKGYRGTGAEWWENLRRWAAGKAFKQMQTSAVEVHFPTSLDISPAGGDVLSLVSLRLDQPMMVPLIAGVKDRRSNEWLKKVYFTALASPVASGDEFWKFIQEVWIAGHISATIHVPHVKAQLPEGAWWAKYARVEKENLSINLNMPIPRLPGLPTPGHQLNFTELVHLDDYSLQTTSPDSLWISAAATIVNPLAHYKPNINVPFHLPFLISLADGSPMAKVTTSSFVLDNSTRLSLMMQGKIIADIATPSQDPNVTSSLSIFLQRYLHGLDNPILVSGLNDIPLNLVPWTALPPQWILDILPTLSVPLSFPGPRPPPKIIQSVAIDHMRISERSGQITASGTVIAQVELPEKMHKVSVDVKSVLPDVLVFDGPADDDLSDNDDVDEDPDQPPARAFGRIKPEEFLNSTTESANDPDRPYRMIVKAPMKDIPLQVLEGRDAIFRSFVSKVVFKGGAEAGIKGTASVKAELKGVEGRAKLDDLPVKGEFWVGRQRGNILKHIFGEQ